jgi:hypothetical protein
LWKTESSRCFSCASAISSRFLHIQGKGLIHYHMFPGIQRQFG